MQVLSRLKRYTPIFICFIFFLAYSILSIIRYQHFESYGFDLGVTDQTVWEYSRFQQPITTVHYYPYTSILTDHIELIYAPLSMFYLLWNNPQMLLVLQAAFMCASALPMYLLAKKKNLNPYICYMLMVSYLTFYGIQNALWFDVHSAVFGASFLAWFVYFMEEKHFRRSMIFFFLAIFSKENVALLTLLISFVFFIKRRRVSDMYFLVLSVVYLIAVFGIYFPYFTKMGYEYQNTHGILTDLNVLNFGNTQSKRDVLFYSFGWYGFLPILSPLSMVPILGDLFSYFVVADHLKEANGLYMHYRVALAPLLTWSTIVALFKIKKLNRSLTAAYLLLVMLLGQYFLHLPLSYLAKDWFWKEKEPISHIKYVLNHIPSDSSLVSQNNITSHLTHRKEIFTLWPEEKNFDNNSPCGKKICNWFRWGGSPKYLIVDTSKNWDIRHLLADRNAYIDGIKNIEKSGYIKKELQSGNTVLYLVVKKPDGL